MALHISYKPYLYPYLYKATQTPAHSYCTCNHNLCTPSLRPVCAYLANTLHDLAVVHVVMMVTNALQQLKEVPRKLSKQVLGAVHILPAFCCRLDISPKLFQGIIVGGTSWLMSVAKLVPLHISGFRASPWRTVLGSNDGHYVNGLMSVVSCDRSFKWGIRFFYYNFSGLTGGQLPSRLSGVGSHDLARVLLHVPRF